MRGTCKRGLSRHVGPMPTPIIGYQSNGAPYQNLSDIAEGDRVYCLSYGAGIVRHVCRSVGALNANGGTLPDYPIKVEFASGSTLVYTADGRKAIWALHQSLFFGSQYPIFKRVITP